MFALSKEDFDAIIEQDCHYCGEPPAMRLYHNNRGHPFNGIDRRDNAVGYVLSNVVPCCKVCNNAKKDLSYESFLSWVRKISAHLDSAS